MTTDRSSTPSDGGTPNPSCEPAEQLQHLWDSGNPPSLTTFLSQFPSLSTAALAHILRVDQEERWQRRERPLAEVYFQAYSKIRDEPDAALDLIFSEYLLREELGENPTLQEYLDRFPRWAEAVRRQIGFHQALLKGAPELTENQTREVETSSSHQSVAANLDLGFLSPAQGPGELGRIGPYTILKVIGRGGMGVVLLARDEALRRVVAVKILAAHLAGNVKARKRFLREAQHAAAINHDHVVTIHAVQEHNGLPYLVMKYVDGESLQQKLDRQSVLPVDELLRIGGEIARGLAAAHDQGVVHRDIKPANILLEATSDRVKITDFGIARAVADTGLTAPGEAPPGTPAYMAPEQAAGNAVDHRADLFSLGILLYVAATGTNPFQAENPLAMLRRIMDDAQRPMSELNRAISPELNNLVSRLLAKDPAKRCQSAQEVAQILENQLQMLPLRNQPTATPAFTPPTPRRAFPRSVKLALAIGGVGAFFLAALLFLDGDRFFRQPGNGKKDDGLPHVPPVNQQAPFVVLGKGDQAERAFGSLAEAASFAVAADSIEIRGNGPFLMDSLDLGFKPLAITAAKGSHPVLELSHSTKMPPMHFLHAKAPLVLEGLELRYRQDPKSKFPLPNLVLANDSLHMAHCRLINSGPGHALCGTEWRSSALVNCQIMVGSWSCVSSETVKKSRLLIDNSILAAWGGNGILLEIAKEIDETSIEIRNSTIWSSGTAFWLRFRSPSDLKGRRDDSPLIHVESFRTLFAALDGLAMVEWADTNGDEKSRTDAARNTLRSLVRFADSENVIDTSLFCQTVFSHPGAGFSQWQPLIPTRQDWLSFWNHPKATIADGPIRFVAKNLLRMETQKYDVRPQDFQLAAGRAGLASGLSGKDLGAAVDLVGPGAAYDAWKQSPVYDEWLRKTQRK